MRGVVDFSTYIDFVEYYSSNINDLHGRRKENITKVRALFADLDGSPIKPILSAKLPPHMIIESSKNKYHAYWLVNDCPLNKFSTYQRAIATKFNSDPKVCDLPRVMRLPGFYHCKEKPYPTTIKQINNHPAYSIKEIEQGLDLLLEKEEIATKTRTTHKKTSTQTLTNTNNDSKFCQGSRNNDLFKVACAMRGRGETLKDAKQELLCLNNKCTPLLEEEEVVELIENVWGRY